ncbi:hypothetical protein B0H34DRAFT_669941 [Crassisporium funariophilum]|nr:hypothetical protein B0H34DRAFT_669941 [Crassisporium funariophilum]
MRLKYQKSGGQDGDVTMADVGNQDMGDDSDWEDEVQDGLRQLPPGEEGFLQSHAGGEAVLQAVMDGITLLKHIDSQTRKDCIQQRVNAWQRQIPHLAKQYLKWKQEGAPAQETSDMQIGTAWSLETVSFSDLKSCEFRHIPEVSYVNETLVQSGFLGASPEKPSLAISLELLEIYRQLRRVCPRFSLNALGCALCHIHHISSAYDCFLEIQRYIQGRHNTALGQSANWEQENVCNPSMDGNNSLKLVDSTFCAGSVRTDARVTSSKQWISPEDVDVFKDEVNKKPETASVPGAPLPAAVVTPTPSSPPTGSMPTAPIDSNATAPILNDLPEPNVNGDDVAWLNVNEIDELAQCVNTCVEHWCNAGPEARKKMFSLFAVAGIFLAVCRHGHVLVICDMIRSGKLMKYPLAIVHCLIKIFGLDICLGYDIMCAFVKTLSRSVLGPKKIAFRLHGVVPSFHGHAHNRGCQLHWHPMYTEGVGLEDFEEFQHINEHFMFHDQDKHAASGTFLFLNTTFQIRRWTRLQPNPSTLQPLQPDSRPRMQIESYLQAKREHLQSLKSEPAEVQQAVDYMELLSKVHELNESDQAKVEYSQLDFNIVNNGFQCKQITAAKEEELTCYEEEHGIEVRWLPNSNVYKATQKLLVKQLYRQAVDNLERLVVQQLFELTKLGMNGVAQGYKLREKISKALRTQLGAIKTALKQYNDAAGLPNLPRDPLTWSTVLKAATVADFDLLCDTRTNICHLPRTEPSRREATSYYFGIKRAREEIVRLNVKITHFLTFMFDTHVDYYCAIQCCMMEDPALAKSLSQQWQYQDRINESNVCRLVQASQLHGFTGSLSISSCIGRNKALSADVPASCWVSLIQSMRLPYNHGSCPGHSKRGEAEIVVDEDDIPREVNVDTDLVVQLIEQLSTT